MTIEFLNSSANNFLKINDFAAEREKLERAGYEVCIVHSVDGEFLGVRIKSNGVRIHYTRYVSITRMSDFIKDKKL